MNLYPPAFEDDRAATTALGPGRAVDPQVATFAVQEVA
jgi:hypothetical protein